MEWRSRQLSLQMSLKLVNTLENSTPSDWYVLYTRPRSEKFIADVLNRQQIECYCPLQKVEKQWSDRRKVTMEPVFRNYLFVKVDRKRMWAVKEINGVVNYVHYLGKPAVVPAVQIDCIKRFLNDHEQATVDSSELHKDQRVRITSGLFSDKQGTIQKLSGNKAWLLVESLGITLQATLPVDAIEPILRLA